MIWIAELLLPSGRFVKKDMGGAGLPSVQIIECVPSLNGASKALRFTCSRKRLQSLGTIDVTRIDLGKTWFLQ